LIFRQSTTRDISADYNQDSNFIKEKRKSTSDTSTFGSMTAVQKARTTTNHAWRTATPGTTFKRIRIRQVEQARRNKPKALQSVSQWHIRYDRHVKVSQVSPQGGEQGGVREDEQKEMTITNDISAHDNHERHLLVLALRRLPRQLLRRLLRGGRDGQELSSQLRSLCPQQSLTWLRAKPY
jgi:hypothetical protein